MDCDQVGSIGALLFLVWYKADSIINILSMDTLVENAIWLHHGDGLVLKFVERLVVFMLMIELILAIRLPHTT